MGNAIICFIRSYENTQPEYETVLKLLLLFFQFSDIKTINMLAKKKYKVALVPGNNVKVYSHDCFNGPIWHYAAISIATISIAAISIAAISMEQHA